MAFAQLAAASRTTTARASVVLLAISASLLCGLYLLRITDLRIVTDEPGRHGGPFHAPPPPPFHEEVTTAEEGKPNKDVSAIEYVSATTEVDIMENVFNRTLGVSLWLTLFPAGLY